VLLFFGIAILVGARAAVYETRRRRRAIEAALNHLEAQSQSLDELGHVVRSYEEETELLLDRLKELDKVYAPGEVAPPSPYVSGSTSQGDAEPRTIGAQQESLPELALLSDASRAIVTDWIEIFNKVSLWLTALDVVEKPPGHPAVRRSELSPRVTALAIQEIERSLSWQLSRSSSAADVRQSETGNSELWEAWPASLHQIHMLESEHRLFEFERTLESTANFVIREAKSNRLIGAASTPHDANWLATSSPRWRSSRPRRRARGSGTRTPKRLPKKTEGQVDPGWTAPWQFADCQ
jgi:hypothetical protein